MTTNRLDKRWVEAGGSVDEIEHFEIIEQGYGRFLTLPRDWDSYLSTTPEFVKVNGVLMASFNLGQWLSSIFAAMLYVTPSATESNRFDACITAGDFPAPDTIEMAWTAITLDGVVGLSCSRWAA